MSAISQHARRWTAIETDRWGVLLAALFLAVLSGSVAIASWLVGFGVEPAMSGSSGGEQAAAGAGWAIAEVIAAAIGIGVILAYRRLPEWVQDVVKTGGLIAAAMWLGVVASSINATASVAIFLIGYYALIKAADHYDVYWLLNNVESIVVAIVGGAAIGAVLPVTFLLVGILGLTVYDHVFANQQDWMFTLGEGMLRAKLPVIVYAFPKLQVSWDEICDSLADDVDGSRQNGDPVLGGTAGFGIGTADLLLPAAFASAVAMSGGGVTLPVIGIILGVLLAAFRLRWLMVNLERGGAGMPSITAGMLAGYGLALVPAVVLL